MVCSERMQLIKDLDQWDHQCIVYSEAAFPGTPLTLEQRQQSRKHAVAGGFAGEFSEGTRRDC